MAVTASEKLLNVRTQLLAERSDLQQRLQRVELTLAQLTTATRLLQNMSPEEQQAVNDLFSLLV